MKVLARSVRIQFERRLCSHLEQTAGIPRARLDVEIPLAIETAFEFGITRECDVARFCELMYRLAGEVAPGRLPKSALNILLAHGVDSPEKLRRLEEWSLESRTRKTAHG